MSDASPRKQIAFCDESGSIDLRLHRGECIVVIAAGACLLSVETHEDLVTAEDDLLRRELGQARIHLR